MSVQLFRIMNQLLTDEPFFREPKIIYYIIAAVIPVYNLCLCVCLCVTVFLKYGVIHKSVKHVRKLADATVE